MLLQKSGGEFYKRRDGASRTGALESFWLCNPIRAVSSGSGDPCHLANAGPFDSGGLVWTHGGASI